MYGIIGCGRCRACLRGLENQCRVVPVGGIGLSRDGGLAEHVVVPASRLLHVGDMDLEQAAPLTDAGLTPYHAVELARPNLRPGTSCVVIGIGGLGHMAVQILVATTAVRVIAVDTSAAALELAARLGAHDVVRAGRTRSKIRAIVGPPPDGADVVLDFVGDDPHPHHRPPGRRYRRSADAGRPRRRDAAPSGPWPTSRPPCRWRPAWRSRSGAPGPSCRR